MLSVVRVNEESAKWLRAANGWRLNCSGWWLISDWFIQCIILIISIDNLANYKIKNKVHPVGCVCYYADNVWMSFEMWECMNAEICNFDMKLELWRMKMKKENNDNNSMSM